MSSSGLIEENMELSHIHLAVPMVTFEIFEILLQLN